MKVANNFSPWWNLATEWRAIAGTLPNGAIEPRLAEFAEQHGKTPNRIRRAAAAQVAAEAMARTGLIEEPTTLAVLALDDVEALKRLYSHGEEVIREPLRRVLHDGLRGTRLLEVERAARALEGAAPLDERAIRLAVKAYHEEVVRAAAAASAVIGVRMARDEAFKGADALPFPLDAVLVYPDGRTCGIRAVGQRPDRDPRSRRRELVFYSLAVTRFLDAIMLCFQDEDEADGMAERLSSLGSSGVKAMHFTEGGLGFEAALPLAGSGPWRAQPPDLAEAVTGPLEEVFQAVPVASRRRRAAVPRKD